jgi:hypothetical protein
MVVFWVVAPCSIWLSVNVSEEHTAYISFLKIEAVCSSETLAYCQNNERRNNPEYHHVINLCFFLSFILPFAFLPSCFVEKNTKMAGAPI